MRESVRAREEKEREQGERGEANPDLCVVFVLNFGLLLLLCFARVCLFPPGLKTAKARLLDVAAGLAPADSGGQRTALRHMCAFWGGLHTWVERVGAALGTGANANANRPAPRRRHHQVGVGRGTKEAKARGAYFLPSVLNFKLIRETLRCRSCPRPPKQQKQ